MRDLTLQIENRADDVAMAVAQIDQFAADQGIPTSSLMRVVVAVGEILTNILSYAFEDNGVHQIEIWTKYSQGEIVIEIIDDGKPFDPLSFPAPDLDVDLDKRKIGGLGIHLVRQLMSKVRYSRQDGRNHFWIANTPPAGE
jgi:anti-sigma regulatory factor (Ser/Thr protein kinase)